MLPGKASKLQVQQTVPKTDTGRQDENSQALERTRVKELGVEKFSIEGDTPVRA